MGYRSDVKGIIYGSKDQIDALLVSAKLTGGEGLDYLLDNKLITEVTIPLPHLDPAYYGLFLQWDDVKWYEDYPEVQAWYRLRDKARDMELNYEFVRIGEDYPDVVRDEEGPDTLGILHLERSIHVDYDLIPVPEEK